MKNTTPNTMRTAAVFAVLAAGFCRGEVQPELQAVLNAIAPRVLQSHVSFLASDALAGRQTPSPGLEAAAEYIAAQMRRSGLEPAGDNGYFQTAKLSQVEANLDGFRLEVTSGTEKLAVKADDVAVMSFGAVELTAAAVATPDTAAADRKGKVLLMPSSELRKSGGMRGLRDSGAALVVVSGFRPRFGARLVQPEDRDGGAPVVFVRSDALAKLAATPGATVDVKIAAPRETPVTLRNIAAVVRGSDPKLKDTYVLVTAHYDHIGVRAQGAGDRINNGANDDASGVASLLEVAAALHASPAKPKRSVLFVVFFGEEGGMIGSTFYARHPIVPLARTVGNINLEHMGRTDDPTGARLKDATITGFNFSDLPQFFVRAGEATGVKVYRDEKRSDPFFGRSDNVALAATGVPAHTMCVAFEFPDYHNVGDEWEKIDYENMAQVSRMVALGVWMMADSDAAPRWSETEEGASRYRQAGAKLYGERPAEAVEQRR